MTQEYTPDPMTPEWSRDLALLSSASFGRGWTGLERRERFVEQAIQYATYDDLPPALKAIYDKASRQGLRNAPVAPGEETDDNEDTDDNEEQQQESGDDDKSD